MLKRSTIFLGLMLTGTLAAAVLVSEEDMGAGEIAAPNTARMAHPGKAATEARRALPLLQLDKLARAKPSEPRLDAFSGKSWYAPPPPPPPPPEPVVSIAPVAPSPPPLPFSYMGRLQEDNGKVLVYLTQGSRIHSVRQGDTIDGAYRLERVAPAQLAFTYLPLGARQTLNTGSAP